MNEHAQGGPTLDGDFHLVNEDGPERIIPALECPRCGCSDVWYWDGYWRCGGCGLEWPAQETG